MSPGIEPVFGPVNGPDSTISQLNNSVGDTKRFQAVGNHDRCPLLCQQSKPLQDQGLTLDVQSACRFIQQQDRGVFQEGTRQIQSLLFSHTQPGGSIANDGVVAFR